ncbi:glycosyltransferase [Diaphorobacter caeni]|uniref:glycosyltransferase n=1 Tax=Diaphorobacter caeni TaxID=2784387 RepID=UPI00189096A4|nr:glycosyltransferase family 2 protein [Diaphorobacter caeni]MBF5004007.1 glycosyltransferase family 2 protein [Diaphorobacter caeni]
MDSEITIPRHLVVSIVSHGHGASVTDLLNDLKHFSGPSIHRVVLTLNKPLEEVSLPGGPDGHWPFELEVRRNESPLGFGENHNRALSGAMEDFVCVLNPDIRLNADPFAALVATAAQSGVGCAYPVQVDETGRVQDSERALPTPVALWQRRVQGQSEKRLDWVNGACLVLPASVWRQVRGFDERYFMYCEDVDLSLRIRLAGWRIVRAPVQLIHAAQRASGRSLSHLAWHVASLLRLWTSSVYRRARQLPPMASIPAGAERT